MSYIWELAKKLLINFESSKRVNYVKRYGKRNNDR